MSEGQAAAGAPAPVAVQRVFVGVPCYDWKVHTAFLRSMLDTQIACLGAGIVLQVYTHDGNCDVDSAQNECLAAFLKSDCSDFVMIGSDEGWRAEDFVRLCKHDRDIVGGSPRKKTDKAEEYVVLLDTTEIWSEPDGLVRVYTIGSGFLRVRRHVIEALAEHSAVYLNPHDEIVARIFRREIMQGRLWSGDNVFCIEAKKLGFDAFVDPEMHFEHIGQKNWRGCLGDWWRSQADLNNAVQHQSRA